MTAASFEIRIAVLGYVSAGKTTVINALLRDKYGQVGMRRTTAGVNYFRLHYYSDSQDSVASTKQTQGNHKSKKKAMVGSPGVKETSGGKADANQDDAVSSSVWVVAEDEVDGCVSAKDALREISEDNVKLRESSTVNVKTFDIAVTEQLCEVRSDTRLVLVDIPGINEAGADGKYRAYVQEHWDTFDCVLVVMDGRHGANTEEQVKLLEFVRDNNRNRKDIPTIIVCNKVDDPDDQEQAELVREAKEEVEKIFAVNKTTNKQPKQKGLTFESPRFVPTSAEFAYIYRTAALMSFEQFRAFDMDLIERLGRRELGRRFNKRSVNDKFRLAYEAATDMELFDERIQATNFDMVLKAIKDAVGGPDAQLQLIQKQIDVALCSLSHKSNYVNKIRDVFNKRQALMQPANDLPRYFWRIYKSSEDEALRSFAASPTSVDKLAKPVKELIEYYEFFKEQHLIVADECSKCVDRLKGVVVRQIGVVLSKEALADADWANREANAEVQWGTLHPIDWVRMLQSIFLLSHSKVFNEHFGRELMLLEESKHKWMGATREDAASLCKCPTCASTIDFNGYCSGCKIFASSTECAALTELTGFAVNHPQTTCRTCHRTCTSSGYCNYCGYSSNKPQQTVKFVTSPSVKASPLELFCPKEGCSKKLTDNRLCAACKVMYCLKDSSQFRSCMFCSAQLKDDRCSSSTCGGSKFTWRELPFPSLREALACAYDSEVGAIVPKYPKTYKSVVKLTVPAELSDPNHMGHVAWTYCQFVESTKDTNP